MEGNAGTPREDLLKEKENRILERSIIKANKEAIRRLREQRIQLLQSCTLSSDSEGETRPFDIEEMDRQWQEESNRTTLVLETIYDNLRMRNATNAYKNTSIIKNKDGEQLYKVTTIIMTEKLSKQANDGTKLKDTVEIKENKCEIKYKYGEEEGNTVHNIENKQTIQGKVIDNKDMRQCRCHGWILSLVDQMGVKTLPTSSHIHPYLFLDHAPRYIF